MEDRLLGVPALQSDVGSPACSQTLLCLGKPNLLAKVDFGQPSSLGNQPRSGAPETRGAEINGRVLELSDDGGSLGRGSAGPLRLHTR